MANTPFTVTFVRNAASPGDQSSLPLATTSEYAALIDARGDPVWPIARPEDMEAVQRIARLFGGGTHECEARRGRVANRAGRVLGIGDVAEQTLLYAHLTRRDFDVLPSIDITTVETLPEVVVTCSPVLDPNLVELMLAAATLGRATTGIVWGRTAAELWKVVLVRAAASMLNGPVKIRRSDVVDSLQLSTDTIGENRMAGQRATADELRATLSAGAGLLSVIVHGSGASVVLASDVVLCSMGQPPAAADRTRAPACITTGVCHQLKLSVSEAVKRRRIIAPSEIAARVFVLGSCQALFVGSQALDAGWSTFPRLNGNLQIGALAATPDLSIAFAIPDDLSEPLATGMPIGRALAAYNGGATASELDQRLLLFGDPRTRAAPPLTSRPIVQAVETRQRRVKPEHTRFSGDQNLCVIQHVGRYIRHDMQTIGTKTSQETLAALELCERPDISPSEIGTAQAALREALIRHLATIKGRAYEGWFPYVHVKSVESTTTCPNCGWHVSEYRCTFSSGLERAMVNCGRCGNIVDAPTASPLGLRVQFPRIELHGPVPQGEWAGAVFVVPEMAEQTSTYRWPSNGAGTKAARVIELPHTNHPPGPLMIRAALIHGTSLHMFGAVAPGAHFA